MEKMNDTIYILDSYALIYRSYYAFIRRPLTSSKGENVSAIFGFFRNLLLILKTKNPPIFLAAFDSKIPTFRHKLYKEYKATRDKTPKDLHAQIPWIEEVLSAMGVRILQKNGYEADDIIATVARVCREKKKKLFIISGDKDLMQLVNENTHILRFTKNDGYEELDEGAVENEWRVKAASLLDLLSITGDSADNVPGVKGVGEKSAAKLLHEWGTLEGIYENIENIHGKLKTNLIEGRESAFFSKKLITLCDAVPLEMSDALLETETEFSFLPAARVLEKYELPYLAKQCREMNATGNYATPPKSENAEQPKNENEEENLKKITPLEKEKQALPPKKNGEYILIQTEKELSSFIDALLSHTEAALDTETSSLDTFSATWLGFSLSYEAGRACYVPIGGKITKDFALMELSRLFSNEKLTLMMHNAKFDLKLLLSQGLKRDDLKCRFADTMVASWLVEPEGTGRLPFALETLSKKYLTLSGIAFNDIVAKGETFQSVPLEKAAEYAGEDADFTFRLWQHLKPILEELGLSSLFFDVEMKIMPILLDMEMYGILLDKNELYSYGLELDEAIKKSEEAIFAEVGYAFNIASPKMLQKVLFTDRALPPSKKTKTGFSTDIDVLEKLSALDCVPKMIVENRELTKMKTTYVKALLEQCGADCRVHPEFVQTGTATGRLSCRSPNLQNIPIRKGRKIRRAFKAADGKLLISADYSQIELVLLAHLCKDEAMCAAFNRGEDIHRETAAKLFGVPLEEVTSEQRQIAKSINFGVIYGMSAFRLSEELKISRKNAKDFIDGYFAHYKKVKIFVEETINGAREKGFVQTILGRRREIPTINSANKIEKAAGERASVNTVVQGSAADLMKKAMIEVDKAIDKKRCAIVLQVHDELLLECDEGATDETCVLVKEAMQNVMKLAVPLKVVVEYGKNWGEFH